jgi:hypothetical protein
MRKQRWSRPESIEAARELQRPGNVSMASRPRRLALAFCYRKLAGREHHHRRHAIAASSTPTSTPGLYALSPELLQAVDAIRWRTARPRPVEGSAAMVFLFGTG